MEGTTESVRAAVASVVVAANRTATLAAGLERTRSRNAATARAQAAKTREASVRAGREEARRAAADAATAAAGIAERLAPGPLSAPWSRDAGDVAVGVLAVADHVRVGMARLALDPTTAIQIPVVLPWLDGGNIVVRASRTAEDRARPLVQEILLRSLLGTGAGQLTLASFDPELSPTLALFAPLRGAHDDLVSTAIADAAEFGGFLDQLTRDVRRVTDMYRGERTTLGGFRRATGQPIESFRVVTVLNYPRGFTPELSSRLATLMRTGPACGINFLVHVDPDCAIPDRVDREPVLREGWSLDLDRGTVAGFEGFDVRWGRTPEPSIVEAVIARLAARVKSAAAPRIDFAALQPAELWSESSAERLVATIGRCGHQQIDIVLGDDVEQKHNVLVTGAVGQGKSNLLMTLIHSLAMRYSPAEVQMFLLDFKDGVTLYPLARHDEESAWLPHARVLGLESDRAYGVAVLHHLVAEFERRAAIIKPFGDNITRFRAARPDASMPRIVAVIDEFHVLFENDDALSAEALLALERLARKGRAYGIHLVLATQTLSGVTGLVAKKDGIFSQFPIRLALHNSAVESRAVLSQTNTEAARLRYRGEVVVNRDFGEVEANTRGVVALAEPSQLAAIRRRMVIADGGRHVPSTFDGGRLPHYDTATGSCPPGPHVLLGHSIGVDPAPAWLSFGPDPGRHLSILGTGKAQPNSASQPAVSLAIAALSLAATSSPDRAEFWVVDVLPDADADHGVVDMLESELARRGYIVRRTDRAGATGLIHDAVAEVDVRREASLGTALHLVVFGVDRIPQITVPNFAADGACTLDDIHTIWQEGVPYDVHLLGWWTNARNYHDHTTNRGKGGLVDVVALFRVAPDAVSDQFGPFVQWSSPDLRVLVRDISLQPDPMVLVPFTLTPDEGCP